MNKSWILDVKQDENGDAILEFPQDLLDETGWKEGTTIEWIDNGDGSWSMKEKKQKYVLVDAISMFRMRYAVAVPEELSDAQAMEWAGDSVTCEDAEEFSQASLGETISSYRVCSQEELLKQFDQDNDYLQSWDVDKKLGCVLVLDKKGHIVSGQRSR